MVLTFALYTSVQSVDSAVHFFLGRHTMREGAYLIFGWLPQLRGFESEDAGIFFRIGKFQQLFLFVNPPLPRHLTCRHWE